MHFSFAFSAIILVVGGQFSGDASHSPAPLDVPGLALVLAFATGSRLICEGGRWFAFDLFLVLNASVVLPFSPMLPPRRRCCAWRQAAEVFPLIWNVDASNVAFILISVLSVSADSGTRVASTTLGNVLTVIPSIAHTRRAFRSC
ncbi:hypothetical protein PBRA_009350 [Plasmodiophora brassicae]|nr:hypothetical protein PBRA_009350 [Plasmodiophora brassicae]